MTDNRDEKIRATLAELSDADNAVWTSDGQPLISAVQQRAGVSVTREDLQKFGRIRKAAPVTEEVADDVDPAQTATNEAEALAAVEECTHKFFAARGVEDAAAIRVRKANAALGLAFTNWMGTTRRDATDVLRENVARDLERKRAVKAGAIKETEAQPPQFQSAIDAQAFYSKGGKAGGKFGAFRRLPSQR